MKAVILAAGRGSRMMPLTKKVPKPMMRVHGKPILEYILESIPQEVEEVFLITGYLQEEIKKHFGDNFLQKKLNYITQEKMEGTWKAINLAKDFLAGEKSFLLLNADDIHSAKSLQELVQHDSAILAATHTEPKKFGVLELSDDGYLKAIEEKPENPKSNLVSTGVFVLSPKIFNCQLPTPVNGEFYLTSVIDEYLQNNKIKVVNSDFWLPIGSPEDLVNAHNII